MSDGKKFLMMLRKGLVLILSIAGFSTASAYDEVRAEYYPEFESPNHLLVVNWGGAVGEPFVEVSPAYYWAAAKAVQSLQGLLLRNGSHTGIYIQHPAPDDPTGQVLQNLIATYGLTSEMFPATEQCESFSILSLLKKFHTAYGGRYVLYDMTWNKDSYQVARMAAYRYGALMVDMSMHDAFVAKMGQASPPCEVATPIELVYDARQAPLKHELKDWTFPYCVESPEARCLRDDLLVFSTPEPAVGNGNFFWSLTDIAVATGARVYYEDAQLQVPGNELSLDTHAAIGDLDIDAQLIGVWPCNCEVQFTEAVGMHDVSLQTMSLQRNAALLMAFRDESVDLSDLSVEPVSDLNTHLVSFMLSDGDNPSWLNTGLPFSDKYWNSPHRGSVEFSWGISPTIRELSSPILRSLLASRSAADGFFAMSPSGYTYPSLFSDHGRVINGLRTGLAMNRSGLEVLTLIDYGFGASVNAQPYLSATGIDALVIWGGYEYAGPEGSAFWVGSKPVLSAFNASWCHASPGESCDNARLSADAIELAAEINARPAFAMDSDSYSIVPIHAWSWSDAVLAAKEIQAHLGSDVKVVTSNQLVSALIRNVSPGDTLRVIDNGDPMGGSYISSNPAYLSVTGGHDVGGLDGTFATKADFASNFAYANLHLSPEDWSELSPASELNLQMNGDGSGVIIRLQLYSTSSQSFLYKDLAVDFTGWRNLRFRLDGERDGMQHWPGTGGASRRDTLSSINIFQISGPWSCAGQCDEANVFLDNVRIVGIRNQLIELGDLRYGVYGQSSSPGLVVDVNSALPNGAGAGVKVTFNDASYGFKNLHYPSALDSSKMTHLEFDLWGDGSGEKVRFELFAHSIGFVFHDVLLDFVGHRHFKLRLDGGGSGLRSNLARRANVLAGHSIFQVSGPWGSTCTSEVCSEFYFDNVKLTNSD